MKIFIINTLYNILIILYKINIYIVNTLYNDNIINFKIVNILYNTANVKIIDILNNKNMAILVMIIKGLSLEN